MPILWILTATQAAVFLLLTSALVEAARNRGKVPKLSEVRPPLPPAPTPPLSVAVIVPARNEEKRIAVSLRSLMASTGLSRLQIIAVNDRSTDATPRLMREEAARRSSPKVSIDVVDVTDIPNGWLGKTNACWQGFREIEASGVNPEFLLFTDADVTFHERALSEAALLMHKDRLDFLTVFPNAETGGQLESAFMLFFGVLLNLFTRPWTLRKPRGRNHLGVGAFMMVRTSVYRELRGHETIRYNITEDLKLALLFRARGYQCAAASGMGRVSVRWQEGFVASLNGLMKVAFPAYDYSILLMLVSLSIMGSIFVLPYPTLFWGINETHNVIGVTAATLAGLNIALIGVIYGIADLEIKLGAVNGLFLSPFMALSTMLTTLYSSFKIITENGVSWRGSFYPLPDLERQCFRVSKAFGGLFR